MAQNEQRIAVSSEDGFIFYCEPNVLRVSAVLRPIIDSIPNQKDVIPIRIPNVNHEILKRVLWWMTNHQNDEDLDAVDGKVDAWDQCFLDTDQNIIIGLIKAANFLDVRGLYIQATNKLSEIISELMTEDNPVRAIRDAFEIQEKFDEDIEQKESIGNLFVFNKKKDSAIKGRRSLLEPQSVEVTHMPTRKLDTLNELSKH
jgi:S-phase kinase-associated protein 1